MYAALMLTSLALPHEDGNNHMARHSLLVLDGGAAVAFGEALHAPLCARVPLGSFRRSRDVGP